MKREHFVKVVGEALDWQLGFTERYIKGVSSNYVRLELVGGW